MKEIIVIGCGAAGMAAAVFAGRNGDSVSVYEKNEKAGKKLYLTGKGRCNFTNLCDLQTLIDNTVSNPKFLYSAYKEFLPSDTIDFFEGINLKTKIERGRRAFPASDRSSDLIKALTAEMKRQGVKVYYNTPVTDIVIKDEKACGVITQAGEKHADAVIVATGGLSYPATGSTGDGYGFAKKAGHKVSDLRPALVPLAAKENFVTRLQGLSLKNVILTIKKEKKVLFSEFGEMLFTHFGISGPLALSASSVIGRHLENNELTAVLDLKPALSVEQLDARLLREFQDNSNKHFQNAVSTLFPAKLRPVIIKRSGISPEKTVNAITKRERSDFIRLIKNFDFTLTGTRGYNEAVITQGGVSVKEIDPGTMESKKIKGLFFVGEVLDVDSFTGGYNLQIAWATGYKAAKAVSGGK